MTDDVPPEALASLPVFPLPGTLLLPQTMVSLHVFEPRYRKMMEHVLDGHRCLAVAMLDENGQPDTYGRPPLHAVAGVGVGTGIGRGAGVVPGPATCGMICPQAESKASAASDPSPRMLTAMGTLSLRRFRRAASADRPR